MVRLTEQAILAVQESMRRAKLDPAKFALYLYVHEGNLSITFTDELDGVSKMGAIFVKVDEIIESHHKNDPLVIDYVTNGSKQGLIFLEESQYERYSNRESS